MGTVQGALIVAVDYAKNRGLQWPGILMAVASAVLLAAGVLRHYIDVYIHRTVRGISFIFVGIDALGDVFSLTSVMFQDKMDVLGIVIYGTELVLWIGIFLCGAYYNLLPWIITKRDQRKSHPAADGNVIPTLTGKEEGHDSGTAATSGIVLHDLPSSTSVFRTPSGDIEVIRQRSLSSTASGRNGIGHIPRRVT